MNSITTSADMKLLNKIFSFTSPADLPLSFCYDGKKYYGIPSEFLPKTEMKIIDANIFEQIITATAPHGLEIRVEYKEYRDTAATEFVAFFKNTSTADTPIISDIKIIDKTITCEKPLLYHGNGDTLSEQGYSWETEPVDKLIVKQPKDGTPCNGAFPYMRLVLENYGINIGIGWPARWKAEFEPSDAGVRIKIGQLRCHTVICPGEELRTPRVNFVAYSGDETRGMNIWRRWYINHILPRENGKALPPKLCMHLFEAGGHPEFTGATQENQFETIDGYLKNGVKPDIWWIDAGWYPCNYEWYIGTGNWELDKNRFPNGLAPVGKKCDENGMQLLLWFEPERVHSGTSLEKEHPEWLIKKADEDNSLLDLSQKDCVEWLINRVDSIIKEGHVKIYRQDFNFDPSSCWDTSEAENRQGAIENLHVQGYLAYWDALLQRNPGLWIDSCSSGGRRNDLETMRRAVPLHYTDVGYGNHPIKQKQHRQMFEWIPYFRAHNMNWDRPNGEYVCDNYAAPDKYSYYVATVPAMTDMLRFDASAEAFDLAKKMHKIWHKAAEHMLSGDFYPLTKCRASNKDFCAAQFHTPETDSGILKIVSNNQNPETVFKTKLFALDENAYYIFTEGETGTKTKYSGNDLLNGVSFNIPVRSGIIYFYQKESV